jgi:hypothetical protein
VGKRHARPPGSGRGPGRPKQPHVASSVERAVEYLGRRRSPGLLSGWLTVAKGALQKRFVPAGERRRVLELFRELWELLPEPFNAQIAELAYRSVRRAAFLNAHDDRARLALTVLYVSKEAGEKLPSATELLALAVVAGCEQPAKAQARQTALLEAWRKRRRTMLRRALAERPLDRRRASSPSATSPPARALTFVEALIAQMNSREDRSTI